MPRTTRSRTTRSANTVRTRTPKPRGIVALRNPVTVQDVAKRSTRRNKAASFAQFEEETSMVGWDPAQGPTERMLKKYGHSTTWVYVAVNRNAQSTAQIPVVIINKDLEGQPNSIIRSDDGSLIPELPQHLIENATAVLRRAEEGLPHPALIRRAKASRAGKQLLELLERPNFYQSQLEFIEGCIVSLELTGNLFIEKVDVDDDGRPEELYVLNPARVTVIPDKEKLVRGYVYSANGKDFPLLPSDVLHVRYSNSMSEHYGLSKLTAARLAMETDTAATQWNKTFLLKGGWPSGALEIPDELDEDSFKRLKRQVKQSLAGGKDTAGRVLILTGGGKYHAISINPKDADWLDARRMSRDEIFMIFGVPPSAAGSFTNENTTTRSAGVEQQLKHYYRTTVSALIKRLLDAFNRDFVRSFADNFKLVPDLRNVPALQDDVQTELIRAQALRTLTAAGLSLNKGLARLMPEVEPEPWGDVAWMNSANVPVRDDAPPVVPEAPKPPPNPPAEKPKKGLDFSPFSEAILMWAEDAQAERELTQLRRRAVELEARVASLPQKK